MELVYEKNKLWKNLNFSTLYCSIILGKFVSSPLLYWYIYIYRYIYIYYEGHILILSETFQRLPVFLMSCMIDHLDEEWNQVVVM